eukprot:12331292-Alexandrium_andersonii.AAC.1
MLAVPFCEELAPPPVHVVKGPEGPGETRSLCSLRLTIWKDLLSLSEWRSMCERPMASVMQVLPKDEVAMAESAWHE